MSTATLMEIAGIVDEVRAGRAAHNELQAILDRLTPEERAYWEEIAPAMLDPDFVVEMGTAIGGHWT